jgi:ABC-2 type transport system ATP-binding protein
MNVVELKGVTKRFGRTVALDGVTVGIPRGSVVGLIGRNGCGKTTLLRHAAGLLLPDAGECLTFGVPAGRLESSHLVRMGVVHQRDPLLPYLSVGATLDFVASFHPSWDRGLEARAMDLLELERRPRVGALSPGNRQRVALLLAICHRPELLLLDEPLADLDPVARGRVMALLLERVLADGVSVVISSHLLSDLEPVVDRIVGVRDGRITANEELDTLKERYAEWVVTSRNGALPPGFPEPYIRSSRIEGRRGVLVVSGVAPGSEQAFEVRYGVSVEARPLGLDRLFPILTEPLVMGVGAPGRPRDRHEGEGRGGSSHDGGAR